MTLPVSGAAASFQRKFSKACFALDLALRAAVRSAVFFLSAMALDVLMRFAALGFVLIDVLTDAININHIRQSVDLARVVRAAGPRAVG